MRSRDLIDGFDYNEHMQRQMFCFGSSDPGDSDSSYSGGLDFDEEFSGDYGPSTSGPSVGGGGGSSYDDELPEAVRPSQITGGETLYTSGAPTLSMGTASQALGNVGGDRGVGGLTRAQYGEMPSYMQDIYEKTGAYNFEFGPQGRVTGFYGPPGGSPFPMANILGKGIVGLTDMLLGPPMTEEDLALRSVYTGFGEGSQPDGGRDGGGDGGTQTVKPVNPVTGQCDAGYIFDEQLNACRLDTRGGAAGGGGVGSVVPPTPGGYARMGLLDVAPTGLPQFQQQYGAGFGTPQDFAAANLNFRRQGATYPEYFQRPPQLSGYTLLS